MNCVLFANMDQVFSKENKTLKKILENWKKYWKSQGILSVRKSGNPDISRMHSSRMRTIHCSGHLSSHASPPTMHAPCHTCPPPPHTPYCHACPPPCMPPFTVHAPFAAVHTLLLPCTPPSPCMHHPRPPWTEGTSGIHGGYRLVSTYDLPDSKPGGVTISRIPSRGGGIPE